MKVNIILITYNHEQYVRQTIESILMQATECDLEIIVADDCSPDGTRALIESISKETDVKFKFLPESENLGYIKNYQRAYAACDGDYIAILEGDDYWTSPHHIQKHVDFLETHKEFSMSFNRHLRRWVEQERDEVFEWNSDSDYEAITTEQLTLGNRIGNLSCCVFRGELIKNIDPQLFEMNLADWMLGMYMGQFGPIAYLKDVTSAYRIHENGQWSKMTQKEQFERIIYLINIYNQYFNYKYNKTFSQYKRGLEINLYGDSSFRGKIKKITPKFIRQLYRKVIH